MINPKTIHATIHTFGHIRKLEIIPDEDEHQYDRLIRRPKTRQYFKGDTLHRGAEERRTSYTELFWDLIFVGAIGLMGHELVHKPDGFHLEQFVLTFIPLYKVWNDVHFYLNVWASEDLVQKFFILWGVVVSTFNQFVGCYLLARLTIAFVYFIFCFFMPKFRIYLLYNIFGNVFSCILWAVSLGMPIASREQANVIWYAIIVDWLWNTAYPAAMKYWPHDKIFCIQKPLYRAAVNIEHMADRLGLFVIITLGESVIALLYSTWSSNINTQAAKGVLGLLLAYNLHWIYFDVDASRQYKHALRRHIFTGLLFVFLHLPLCAAIVIMGSTLGVLVQVMDFPGSENIPVGLHGAERLTEIPPGIDWLFCGSLSMAICCLATIGLSHQSMDAVDLMKIHKRWRISFRYVTAAIFAVLPLAKLNSLSLLAIVSSLSLVLVIVETVGRLRRTGRSDKEKQGGDIEQGEESNVEDRGLWVRWSSHFRSRSTNDITSALQWTSTFSSSRTLNMSGPTDDGSRRRWFSQNSRSSLDEKKHGVKGAPFEMCI
ncbi:bacterial low temperature requirement A protein-domain-containing protein [Jimgerdemannia flammicorona]|uniref:Bacterial low temperature requirement A protein-domain-containing protein n=1 Tax=Jimgerdemannia flammicorona TaxID=994334 RepID=A0A433DB00_9FUNG|nr:bacterial low temperature requirement A protein-domain-containing protein [Jimgerdemannia flammicorona]